MYDPNYASRRRRRAALLLCAVLTVAGCGDDDDDNPAGSAEPEWLPVATQTIDGVAATLYAWEDPVVGYNRLSVELRDAVSDAPLSGPVSVMPMMRMPMADGSTMSHSAPVPLSAPADADGRAAAEVVFIMAGAWELQVGYESGGRSGTLVLPVEVAPSSRVQALTDGDEPLFVTLVEPLQPRVGMNDLVLAVHRRETMMSFPGVADLAVTFEPSMPSMGHGSPDNVAPEPLGGGLYRGAVNFTMTGDWRIDVGLREGDRGLPGAHFELTVE